MHPQVRVQWCSVPPISTLHTYSRGCGVLSDLVSSDLHNWRLSETARDEANVFGLDAHIRPRLLRLVFYVVESTLR